MSGRCAIIAATAGSVTTAALLEEIARLTKVR